MKRSYRAAAAAAILTGGLAAVGCTTTSKTCGDGGDGAARAQDAPGRWCVAPVPL